MNRVEAVWASSERRDAQTRTWPHPYSNRDRLTENSEPASNFTATSEALIGFEECCQMPLRLVAEHVVAGFAGEGDRVTTEAF